MSEPDYNTRSTRNKTYRTKSPTLGADWNEKVRIKAEQLRRHKEEQEQKKKLEKERKEREKQMRDAKEQTRKRDEQVSEGARSSTTSPPSGDVRKIEALLAESARQKRLRDGLESGASSSENQKLPRQFNLRIAEDDEDSSNSLSEIENAGSSGTSEDKKEDSFEDTYFYTEEGKKDKRRYSDRPSYQAHNMSDSEQSVDPNATIEMGNGLVVDCCGYLIEPLTDSVRISVETTWNGPLPSAFPMYINVVTGEVYRGDDRTGIVDVHIFKRYIRWRDRNDRKHLPVFSRSLRHLYPDALEFVISPYDGRYGELDRKGRVFYYNIKPVTAMHGDDWFIKPPPKAVLDSIYEMSETDFKRVQGESPLPGTALHALCEIREAEKRVLVEKRARELHEQHEFSYYGRPSKKVESNQKGEYLQEGDSQQTPVLRLWQCDIYCPLCECIHGESKGDCNLVVNNEFDMLRHIIPFIEKDMAKTKEQIIEEQTKQPPMMGDTILEMSDSGKECLFCARPRHSIRREWRCMEFDDFIDGCKRNGLTPLEAINKAYQWIRNDPEESVDLVARNESSQMTPNPVRITTSTPKRPMQNCKKCYWEHEGECPVCTRCGGMHFTARCTQDACRTCGQLHPSGECPVDRDTHYCIDCNVCHQPAEWRKCRAEKAKAIADAKFQKFIQEERDKIESLRQAEIERREKKTLDEYWEKLKARKSPRKAEWTKNTSMSKGVVGQDSSLPSFSVTANSSLPDLTDGEGNPLPTRGFTIPKSTKVMVSSNNSYRDYPTITIIEPLMPTVTSMTTSIKTPIPSPNLSTNSTGTQTNLDFTGPQVEGQDFQTPPPRFIPSHETPIVGDNFQTPPNQNNSFIIQDSPTKPIKKKTQFLEQPSISTYERVSSESLDSTFDRNMSGGDTFCKNLETSVYTNQDIDACRYPTTTTTAEHPPTNGVGRHHSMKNMSDPNQTLLTSGGILKHVCT